MVVIIVVFYGAVAALAAGLVWILHIPLDVWQREWWHVATAPVQIGIGAVVGGVAGRLICALIDRTGLFRDILDRIRTFLDTLDADTASVVLLAGSAGFAEELLFRGVIDYRWGAWIAAAGFTLAHGLPMGLRFSGLAYSAYVFMAGLGFSSMTRTWGLISAMVAHAVIDWMVLRHIMRSHR